VGAVQEPGHRGRRRTRPPAPREPATGPGGSIVHGDFRIDNTILGRDMPPEVKAVLDWSSPPWGSRWPTSACSCSTTASPPTPRPAMTPAPTMQPGFPFSRLPGRAVRQADRADISNLSSWVALAHFKSAAIAQGIAARVRAGSMAGQDFGTSRARSSGSPPKARPPGRGKLGASEEPDRARRIVDRPDAVHRRFNRPSGATSRTAVRRVKKGLPFGVQSAAKGDLHVRVWPPLVNDPAGPSPVVAAASKDT